MLSGNGAAMAGGCRPSQMTFGFAGTQPGPWLSRCRRTAHHVTGGTADLPISTNIRWESNDSVTPSETHGSLPGAEHPALPTRRELLILPCSPHASHAHGPLSVCPCPSLIPVPAGALAVASGRGEPFTASLLVLNNDCCRAIFASLPAPPSLQHWGLF